MFEAGYAFRLATKQFAQNEYPLLERSIYTFTTRLNRTYIVNIHRYEYRVYVIKFHDKNHSDSKNKYSLILNDYDVGKVLKTILEIAITILREDTFASFAFVGAHKIGKETSTTVATQRYRVYKRLTEYFLGGETFIHTFEEQSNSYLLINRSNPGPEDLSETVISMFADTFQGLEHL